MIFDPAPRPDHPAAPPTTEAPPALHADGQVVHAALEVDRIVIDLLATERHDSGTAALTFWVRPDPFALTAFVLARLKRWTDSGDAVELLLERDDEESARLVLRDGESLVRLDVVAAAGLDRAV